MHNINKFPIIIVSSPRTGSTILAEYLAKRYNLKLFSEPDANKSITDEFYSYIQNKNKNFVLKFHARNFNFFQDLDIFANSYLISIQRKNLVEQIASHYTALSRQIWIYNKENKIINSSIPINFFEVMNNSEVIMSANKALAELSLNFDAKLFYENLDLSEYSQKSDFVPTPKPDNYEYLLAKIKKYLKYNS